MGLINNSEVNGENLGGDVQKGKAGCELLPLIDKSEQGLVVEEDELLPDTGGWPHQELLFVRAANLT